MASTIITKNGTGSAVPTSLQQGELAINTSTGQLYYGTSASGSMDASVSSSFTFASVSASGKIITHQITASGNISSSGRITAATLDATAVSDTLAAAIVAEIDNDEIPIAKLAEDAVTVTAGTNLSNGGTVTLGGSITLNVDDAFLKNDADDTTSGTITSAGLIATKDTDGGDTIIQVINSNTDGGLDKGAGIEFKHGSSAGSLSGNQKAGKILSTKVSSYLGVADAVDSNLEFYTANNQTDTLQLKIDNLGLAAFTGDVSSSGDVKGLTLTTPGNITGSTIEGQTLTADVFLSAPSASITNLTNTNITSSGNISSSGRIDASIAHVHGTALATNFQVGNGGKLFNGANSNQFLKFDNSAEMHISSSAIQLTGEITASGDISASNFIGAPIQLVTHAWFSNYASADWALTLLTSGDDNFGWADRVWDHAVDKTDVDAGDGNTGTFTHASFNKGVRLNHDVTDIELTGTLRPSTSVNQLNYYLYKGTTYNGGASNTTTFLASASATTTTTARPNDIFITGSTGLQASKGDYLFVFANADLGSGNMKGSYTVTAKTRK